MIGQEWKKLSEDQKNVSPITYNSQRWQERASNAKLDYKLEIANQKQQKVDPETSKAKSVSQPLKKKAGDGEKAVKVGEKRSHQESSQRPVGGEQVRIDAPKQ
jgi:hypothetical protein